MAMKLPSVLADFTAPRPLAPPSESGWYRCYTPLEDFSGVRCGKLFQEGEAIVGAHELVSTPLPGAPDQQTRLIDKLVRDLGYSAVPIPVGVPPVPRSALPPEPLPVPPDLDDPRA